MPVIVESFPNIWIFEEIKLQGKNELKVRMSNKYTLIICKAMHIMKMASEKRNFETTNINIFPL